MFAIFKIFGFAARAFSRAASALKKINAVLREFRAVMLKIARQPGSAVRIDAKIEGIEQVQAKLDAISPDRIFPKAVKAAWPEIERILRDYPPEKYVSRTQAYGQPFSSEKQRRWFFAALRSGEISVPYHRTGALGRAWKLAGHSTQGMGVKVSNAAPGAAYVYGIGVHQAAQPRLVGWPQYEELTERIGKVLKAEIERQILLSWRK